MSMPLENAEEDAVQAGKRMIEEVRRIQNSLSLRVGIASGPLIGMREGGREKSGRGEGRGRRREGKERVFVV
jgi:hypothetical protein